MSETIRSAHLFAVQCVLAFTSLNFKCSGPTARKDEEAGNVVDGSNSVPPWSPKCPRCTRGPPKRTHRASGFLQEVKGVCNMQTASRVHTCKSSCSVICCTNFEEEQQVAGNLRFVDDILPQLSRMIEDLTKSAAQHEFQTHPHHSDVGDQSGCVARIGHSTVYEPSLLRPGSNRKE